MKGLERRRPLALKHRLPNTPLEADGEHLPMVTWYSMITSYNVLDMLVFLKLFLGRFDIRTQQVRGRARAIGGGRQYEKGVNWVRGCAMFTLSLGVLQWCAVVY